MDIKDFDYVLPEDRIAHFPAEPRDSSRLLFLDRSKKSFSDHVFSELPELLPTNAVLVFNQSKVIPARLLVSFKNREVEIFFVRAVNLETWLCMIRPAKYFPVGQILEFFDGWKAEVIEVMESGMRKIRFEHKDLHVADLLSEHGKTPLPPYIHNEEVDPEKYQTVYAKDPGSVAAPTAGLHFTDALLERLRARGFGIEFVTLHVGPGTFIPVKTERVEDHVMHDEFFEIDVATAERLNQAKKEGRKIIAVGTTSNRVLESCASEVGVLRDRTDFTRLFIYPGYRWKFTDGLVTNFHLPKSTLLMLVSAFAGRDFVFEAYQHAISHDYRFFSFGDAMLIL